MLHSYKQKLSVYPMDGSQLFNRLVESDIYTHTQSSDAFSVCSSHFG